MTEITLQKLVTRLERVAQVNKDEFEYSIRIKVRNGMAKPEFVCQEVAEKHEFFSRNGETIEEAIALAWNDVAPACEAWGYKNVE
jgi:hypothetical protein